MISAEICYQTVKPQLVDHIRGINNSDINKFVGMYDALPNLPFIMKQEVLDIVTGVEAENLIVSEFSLEQNYPNPFNPSTKIKYSIPSVDARESNQSQLVTLKVYDMLGNEVSTLVNEVQQAGSYEIEFSADGLTSGIYFYKLQVGEFTDTKKMILLR